MRNAIHTEKRGDLTIKILPDESESCNPRDNDNLGTMVCWHREYKLGDKHSYKNPDDFFESLAREYVGAERVEYWYQKYDAKEFFAKIYAVVEENVIFLPLYLMDHSGISISTGSFNDPWDSGRVGYIYITKEKIREEYSCTRIGPARRQKVLDMLVGETKEYDNFLTGNVYGYIIEDGAETQLDSVWGFIGDYNMDDGILSEARRAADYLLKERAEAAALASPKSQPSRTALELAQRLNELGYLKLKNNTVILDAIAQYVQEAIESPFAPAPEETDQPLFNLGISAKIEPNGNLVLVADEATQAQLRRARVAEVDFQSDDYMREILENLICNSEYAWIEPTEIGALTDAPILGIRSQPRALREGEYVEPLYLAGHWDDTTWVEDVTSAWAYMDYQVRFVQEDLADKGRAVLINAGIQSQPEQSLPKIKDVKELLSLFVETLGTGDISHLIAFAAVKETINYYSSYGDEQSIRKCLQSDIPSAITILKEWYDLALNVTA